MVDVLVGAAMMVAASMSRATMVVGKSWIAFDESFMGWLLLRISVELAAVFLLLVSSSAIR